LKEDIHKKIEETLNSLDGMQRAETNPFLYNKIRNKLDGGKEFVPRKLAWKMVIALAIVTVINVFSFLHFNQKQKSSGAELVAKEYSISLPQSY
jgi:hypothetical protein